MTEPTTPTTPSTPSDERTPWVLIVGAVVSIALIAIGIFLLVRDDDDEIATIPSASTAAASSVPPSTVPPSSAPPTTEVPATSAPTTAPPVTSAPTTEPTVPPTSAPAPDGSEAAIWPWVDSDVRFTDPVVLTRSFATEFLDFVDPIIGEFLQGDERSGEVEVSPFEGAMPTTVFVRLFGDPGEWFVIGAANANIVVDEPRTRDMITSPVEVVGAANAFEGTVEVEIRADGREEPLFSGFVTGASGELGSFRETFEWDAPTEGAGSMVFLSRSSEDGAPLLDAGVIRVFFGP